MQCECYGGISKHKWPHRSTSFPSLLKRQSKSNQITAKALSAQRDERQRTLDLRSLMMTAVVRMATDLLTSTIMRTVGRVDATFCGWGGRMVTGTHPGYTHSPVSIISHKFPRKWGWGLAWGWRVREGVGGGRQGLGWGIQGCGCGAIGMGNGGASGWSLGRTLGTQTAPSASFYTNSLESTKHQGWGFFGGRGGIRWSLGHTLSTQTVS